MLVNELLRDIETGVPADAILNSVFEIEDVLTTMKDVDRRIEHLKGLKKYRMDSINTEITKWEERTNQLRELVLRSVTKLEPDQKTFHFPDVAKITRRSSKGSWEITNESSIIDQFKKLGVDDQVIVTKEVLDKRKAKKLVAELSDKGTKIDGAKFTDGTDSISITFENASQPKLAKKNTKTDSIESLDELEV